jgi:hypothetical protein
LPDDRAPGILAGSFDTLNGRHEMERPAPQAEHRWLQQLVGEWTFDTEYPTGPEGGMTTYRGTESVQPFGELWVVADIQGESPFGPSTSRMTLGYDPAKARFVGTFVGASMPSLWVYEGSLDGDQRALSLESEGPSFTDEGRLAPYRDVLEFQGPDAHTLTSYIQDEDGSWEAFMTMRYRRA